MSGHMASLKKPRDATRFPLALNPRKSKDVLAVLAERNQTIVPVGAWVEPASPDCPQIPAQASAFLIEEELKEQQRQKQESLKHFQRQVKHRVNQQIRLRKKQQLQKSYKAAEKEGCIVMQCSDSAHLTPKRTSVFQSNLNAAIGSSRLPPSWMLGDLVEDGENQHQNELFQQAQALSQTMKQARHQLASCKTVSEKKEPVFLNGRMQSFPTQEEVGYKEMSFVMTDEKEPLSRRYQQDCHSKDKDKPFSRVQDQDFLPEDEDFLLRDQHVLPKDQNVLPKCQDQDFLPSGRHVLPKDQNNLHKCQSQDLLPQNQGMFFKQPSPLIREERVCEELPQECHQSAPLKIHDQAFPAEQYRHYGQASHDLTDEKRRKDLFPESHGYGFQDPGSAREQSLYAKQRPSDRTTERWQEDLHLDGHQRHPSSLQRDTCSRRQVYECHLGRSTESQAPLTFQSGVDQEEDKKERQKQYLRHRRLFMDIEREQAKEQQRQREQKKKVEKIKKKKERQRYAEEQRILRMNSHEIPYSGEKKNDILAQLQLDKIQAAREKQQQKEKEYARYVEALRAQVQEKMKLYNITLPPLCCCGPDFWDAHPDTCANNCIFYKNYRAYSRALHSVINSSDISEGTTTLRNAIRNFACAYQRTSKRVCNRTLKSAETTGSILAFS